MNDTTRLRIIQKPLRFLRSSLAASRYLPGSVVKGALPAILCAALLLTSACSRHEGAIPKESASVSANVLAPGDVLKLSYPGAAEYNQVQRIRPDGKVSLPHVGEVVAGGKTLGAFQAQLAELYKEELKVNEVVVSVDTASATVTVTGAVASPGKVPLVRPMTIVDAIEESGGVTNLANKKKVTLVRTIKGRHYSQVFDLKAQENGDGAIAFYLKPYDRIIVPERFF